MIQYHVCRQGHHPGCVLCSSGTTIHIIYTKASLLTMTLSSPSEPITVSGMDFRTGASSAGEVRHSRDVSLAAAQLWGVGTGPESRRLFDFILLWLLLIRGGTGGQGVKIENCAICDRLSKNPRTLGHYVKSFPEYSTCD